MGPGAFLSEQPTRREAAPRPQHRAWPQPRPAGPSCIGSCWKPEARGRSDVPLSRAPPPPPARCTRQKAPESTRPVAPPLHRPHPAPSTPEVGGRRGAAWLTGLGEQGAGVLGSSTVSSRLRGRTAWILQERGRDAAVPGQGARELGSLRRQGGRWVDTEGAWERSRRKSWAGLAPEAERRPLGGPGNQG